MYKVLFVIICVFVFVNSSTFADNIFLPDSDIEAVKDKLTTERFKEPWAGHIALANDICDPASKQYGDPAAVDSGFEQQNTATRGSLICRRMGRWMDMLGFAYRLSGDEKYAKHGTTLILAACEKLPLDGDVMSVNLPGGRGDMIRSLGFAYAMFGDYMNAQQKDIIFKTAVPYIEDAISKAQDPQTGWYKYHNWNGVNGGAIGIFSLAAANDYPMQTQKWLKDAIEIVNRWIEYGFDGQGAYLEGVSYSSYGLDNSLLFLTALYNTKGENLFVNPRLKQIPQFYALSLLPGEDVYEARNDSYYGGIKAQMLALAKFNNDGLAKWLSDKTAKTEFWHQLLWDNDAKPLTPKQAKVPLAQYFQGRGLCIWRSGWEKDDVMFSVEAGKYYSVTHNQADKGHFTLYGFGYRWACDAGYANNREPLGRGQTAAHNCVLIDGKGQAVSGSGAGTDGKIIDYENNDKYGYALADCTDAYNVNNHGDAGAVVKKAYRHTLFVRASGGNPAYAVILDDIVKNGEPREYCWQMLSWPDLEIAIEGTKARVSPKKPAGADKNAKMFVFLDAQSPLTLSLDVCDVGDDKKPSQYPRLRGITNAVNPYFAAVLVPTTGKMPQVRFDNSPTEKLICVQWPDKTDMISWDKAGKTKPLFSSKQ